MNFFPLSTSTPHKSTFFVYLAEIWCRARYQQDLKNCMIACNTTKTTLKSKNKKCHCVNSNRSSPPGTQRFKESLGL